MTSADLKDEVEPPFPFSSSGWLAVVPPLVLAAPSKPPVEAALKPPVKAPVEVVG